MNKFGFDLRKGYFCGLNFNKNRYDENKRKAFR
jgi:hypothetical protein